jgi:mono/diheme cytochrome c family protein
MKPTPSFLVNGIIMGLLVALVVALTGFLLTTSDGWAEEGNAQNGKKTYEQLCLMCHGQTGKGDGPTGQFLTPKPSNFAKNIPQHGDNWKDYYFRIIQGGGTSVGRSSIMPAWKAQLKDSEIWDVISYIQTFVNGH